MAKISKKKWLYGCIALFLGSFGAYKSYYVYQNYFYPHRFDRYESNLKATIGLNKAFPKGTPSERVKYALENDGYVCSEIVETAKSTRLLNNSFQYVFSCNPLSNSERLMKYEIIVKLNGNGEVLEIVRYNSFLGL